VASVALLTIWLALLDSPCGYAVADGPVVVLRPIGDKGNIKRARRVKIVLENYRNLVYDLDCMMYLFQFRSDLKGTRPSVTRGAREVT